MNQLGLRFDLQLRRPLALLPTLLLALALSACGGAPEYQSFILGNPPWQAGEQSLYRLVDLNEQYAGTAQYDVFRGSAVLVGGSDADDEGWTLQRTILAQGVEENAVIEVTDLGLRPRVSSLVRNAGSGGTERVLATYSGAQVDLELISRLDVLTYERTQIPSDALDQRTLPLVVRALPLEAGYATRFNSFLPVANLLERIELEVTGDESITVGAGNFDAWRVEMRSNRLDDDTIFWVSKETPFPIVRIEDGRSGGVFELSGFLPRGEE